MDPLRNYLLALQYFTRVPVTGAVAQWADYSPHRLRASAAHFPGVGALVGLCAAGVAVGLLLALKPTPLAALVAAAASTVVTVLLTGGLHEDGLADVADGLGGFTDRERALEIMKDSRVGPFGALALVLALLLKVSLLALIGAGSAFTMGVALFLAHVVSRTWPLLVIRRLPHVGDTARSKSKPLADTISRATLAAGFGWLLLSLGVAGWMQGALFVLAPLIASLLVLLMMIGFFRRRLGGFTGDCLGATQQVCEIACYLGVALTA
ncbi:MAG: cobalamin synthase-like protein [Ramlibacter sp.]|jgi:adenosylcobinamide-GDP ribazoletransferase|uniref:adenosylcobinamide-GDP ribazoletransferase n=1 Tax=Ramlibacter sp. TaxID=1917967 RepID=UPI002608BBCA|nr:adenosylcobinamide-GDP ribazoletransferase [Ramlibacter sp.]MDB5752691.1 cobalamin synthase-like protein [Ramlibacter sp.]